MGQSIGWHRLKDGQANNDTVWADDAPDYFDERFAGRWEWFNALLDNPHVSVKTCGCGDKCYYGCGGESVMRSTDFAAFRARLAERGLFNRDEEAFRDGDIFREMADWLEAHPDVYVEFS